MDSCKLHAVESNPFVILGLFGVFPLFKPNSVDQMPHFAASNLGLHCLARGARHLWNKYTNDVGNCSMNWNKYTNDVGNRSMNFHQWRNFSMAKIPKNLDS